MSNGTHVFIVRWTPGHRASILYVDWLSAGDDVILVSTHRARSRCCIKVDASCLAMSAEMLVCLRDCARSGFHPFSRHLRSNPNLCSHNVA